MKIGVVSLDQVWEDKVANKILCKNFAESASKVSLDLIIFPEMTLTGFSMNTKCIAEKIEDLETVEYFKGLAKYYKIGIIFGLCINDLESYSNTAVYVSKEGTVEASYKKIYPFSFAGENEYYSPGNEISVFKIQDLNIGLTICYDLRFPELYRLYADYCHIVINIANWPEVRIDHWFTLLKARAIENQFIIIGVNRIGIDYHEIKYIESSDVFLSDGSRPHVINHEFGLKSFEVFPNYVKDYRKSFPVLQDRKELSKIIINKILYDQ